MKNMKNMKIILIIVIFVMICIGIFFCTKSLLNSNKFKIEKGYKIWGSNICNNKNQELFYEDSEHPMAGGCVITPWKCTICRKADESPITATPALCIECAHITNRCHICGKLLNSK